MKKLFCLDTNVLLYDPDSLFSFDNNLVILPLAILGEIDRKKGASGEVGANARRVSRILDDLRTKGDLKKGIKTKNLKLQIVDLDLIKKDNVPSEISDFSNVDNVIIATAMHLTQPGHDLTLITKDILVRVIASTFGIKCEDYTKHRVARDTKSIYQGVKRLQLTEKEMADFYSKDGLLLSKDKRVDENLHPNEILVMKVNDNDKAALGRFLHKDSPIAKLTHDHKPWGLKARNKEQKFALDLLMDPEVKLVTLVGKAGTGKTLLSVAAGIQQTIESNDFSRLIISRPVYPLGNDLGYLPGTMEDKMLPWTKPILDNLQFLFREGTEKNKGNSNGSMLSLYFQKGMIEVEAITYMRGRSISDAFIIIDEAQNLSVHELKTIITRAGENTKIILTGDIEQIDNSYVDAVSNGLTYAVEKFKDHTVAGHVNLIKGERSPLATLASKIL